MFKNWNKNSMEIFLSEFIRITQTILEKFPYFKIEDFNIFGS